MRVASSTELFIVKYKSSHPCADCDHYFPYFVMQFDHVRGEKLFELSISGHYRPKTTGRNGRTLKEVQEEIEKCDLVCANCHAVRTHRSKHDS